MTLDTFEPILTEALRIVGGSPCTFSAEGSAETDFHGLTIGFQYDERGKRLCLYCGLGRLPSEPSSALCEFLLEANLLGSDTGGGHIGLHAPSRILLFSLWLDTEGLDSSRLANALMRFTEKAAGLIAGTAEHMANSSDSLPLMMNVIWA